MFAKNRIGFMPGLYVAFLEELSSDDKKHFSDLTDEKERADYVLNHPFIKDKFNHITGLDRKNNQHSVKAREEGNTAFQSGNFKLSLVKYSVAVCQADQSTQEYGLALANRSAALQRLKHFNKGVEDVDRAVAAGYPQDKLFKLLERKGQMLVELRRYSEAKMCFEKAKKLVQLSSLSEAKVEKFKSDIKKNLQKVANKSDDNVKPAQDSLLKNRIAQVKSPHPLYPALDDSVQIKFTQQQGRFAVASKDIPAGTTILVEDPLGWTLEAEKFTSNCQHCLCEVTIPVPCSTCTAAVFCSDTCRDDSWSQYHARECGVQALCVAAALNNFCFLSLRALARMHVSQLLDMDTCRPDIEHGTTCDDMMIYRSDDIRNGLNLVHHSETVSTDDKIMRTLVSVFLMRCLKLTRFSEAVITTSDQDLHIAALIHQMISACPANTHEIHSLVTPTLQRWSPMAELQELGAGLYPTAALFNHSCDPNIVRTNIGRSMISVTTRTIRAGEEIHDCYGLPWYSKTRDLRQEITSKFYKFSCQCPPCSETWVTSDMLASLSAQVATSSS